MIRNIFNWVGGGFFRTIGRFVAFIVLGAIAYILIGKSNIKITDLLGIETVKASEWESVWIAPTVKYQINNGSWYNTSVSTDNYHTISSVTGTNKYRFQFTSQKTLTSSQEMLYFTTKLSFYQQEEDVGSVAMGCIKWELQNGAYNCTQISPNFATYEHDLLTPLYSITFSYRYNVNGTAYYKQCLPVANAGNSFTFRCPNTSNAVDGVEVSVYDGYGTIGTYSVGIYYLYTIEKSDAQSIIDNQNQNTNATISAITDTNMTETNSTATSFFDNFTDTDHGGLSSIITAPLSTINNMLSNTCVAPSATWKGATITLPCGDMLWSRPGAQDLRNLLNVFYGGFVCYYAIRRLFFLIENLKDPTKDNLEVTDL